MPQSFCVSASLVASLILTSFAYSASARADSWRAAAPMPLGVQEIYADTLDGLIYIGGGIPKNQANFTDQFLAYDAKTDTWTKRAPLPERRHHIAIAATDDKIYGFGGFTGAIPRWRIHGTTFIYDVKSNTWSSGAKMPTPRAEHTASAIDGKIYIIGGRVARVADANTYSDYGDTNVVAVFDTKTNTFTRAADAPTARNSHAAAVIDGKVYVVGGRQFSPGGKGRRRIVNVAALEVYDPKTNTWETKAPMPLAQGGLAAATVDGKLYVFGGEQFQPKKKVFENAWVYDPKSDRWSALPPMPHPRHGLAAAAVGSEIFVFGGANIPGAGAVDTNEALVVK